MLRDEQSKMVSHYFNLENRYQEVLQENKWIKNEILDLRRQKDVGKYNDPNLPLNKSINLDKRNQTLVTFSTPNKIDPVSQRDSRYERMYPAASMYKENFVRSPDECNK